MLRLVVVYIFSLLIFIRLQPVVFSDFPVNDGGLFYAMISDLKDNDYQLPKFTSYNRANIPFAYPPLAFYLAAMVSDLTGMQIIDVLHWLPAVLSVLTIPVFYWLSRKFLESKEKSVIATIIFSLHPRGYDWQIMGGGLTRVMGMLTYFLAFGFSYRLFEKKAHSIKYVLLTALFCSLSVLSHPESAMLIIISLLLIFIIKDRTVSGFFKLAKVFAGIAIFSAPWWMTIILNHGLSPFIAALSTGGSYTTGAFNLISFNFAQQPFLDILGVLGIVGLILLIAEWDLLFPSLFFAMMVINSRSAERFITFPLSIAGAIAIIEIIVPGIEKSIKKTPFDGFWLKLKEFLLIKKIKTTYFEAINIVMVPIIFSALISAYAIRFDANTVFKILPSQEREAMSWVSENTQVNSQFLVIPGDKTGNWALEMSMEWFPVLADRDNIAAIQGYEWIPGEFRRRLVEYRKLGGCRFKTLECLREWEKESGRYFTHIYLSKLPSSVDNFSSPTTTYQLLNDSLSESQDFELIFENTASIIYQKKSD